MRINRLPVCMLFGDIAVSGMLCATLIIGASSSTNSAVAQLQLACCLRRRAVRTGVFADAAGCQPDRFLAGSGVPQTVAAHNKRAIEVAGRALDPIVALLSRRRVERPVLAKRIRTVQVAGAGLAGPVALLPSRGIERSVPANREGTVGVAGRRVRSFVALLAGLEQTVAAGS